MNKNNRIDLSKYNTRKDAEEEPLKPTVLSQLFKEADDPLQRQKDRNSRFGCTSQNVNHSSESFTK